MFTALLDIFYFLFLAKRTRKKQLEARERAEMDLIRYRNAFHSMRSQILNEEIQRLIDQGKVEDAMHLVRQSNDRSRARHMLEGAGIPAQGL
jgi:hypothetical protein